MKAVWLADLAVELCLATIVSDYNLDSDKEWRFSDYLSAIGKQVDKSELQSLKKFFARVNSLHKSRNRVHDGIALDAEDAERAVGVAEAFIRTAFLKVYKVDLDRLSFISFLNDSEVKRYLKAAQELVESENYDEAAFNVALAFEKVKSEIEAQLFIGGKKKLWGKQPTIDASMPGKILEAEIFDPSTNRIAFAVEMSRFGISMPDAADFLGSLMEIDRAPGTHASKPESWVRFNHEPFTKQKVNDQIRFLAEATYQLEQNWRRGTWWTSS